MKLEDIEKLCNEATPGPWILEEGWCEGCSNIRGGDNFSILGDEQVSDADAKFIVASRELMPKLLAVAKAAKRASERFHGIDGIDEALRELEQE